MRTELQRHPESRGGEGLRVSVDAHRSGATLRLAYSVIGDSGLRLPGPAAPERTDELWRHTCFEAFVGGEAYYELNFAPSTQWAAYRFEGYREGMAPAALASPPVITRGVPSEGYRLEVEVRLDGLPELPATEAWPCGLSAVLEDAEGGISYWAAAHPTGKPDFHHPDSFALELLPTDPS